MLRSPRSICTNQQTQRCTYRETLFSFWKKSVTTQYCPMIDHNYAILVYRLFVFTFAVPFWPMLSSEVLGPPWPPHETLSVVFVWAKVEQCSHPQSSNGYIVQGESPQLPCTSIDLTSQNFAWEKPQHPWIFLFCRTPIMLACCTCISAE